MGDYFKPLRRKFGVLTLVMACMFAAGLVRSLAVNECASSLTSSNTQFFILSDNGFFYLGRNIGHDPKYFSTQPILRWVQYDSGQHISPEDYWQNLSWYWRFSDVGIVGHYSGSASTIDQILFVIMPYWVIVIPLTLLSAWLLLSKTRPAKYTASTGQSSPSQSHV